MTPRRRTMCVSATQACRFAAGGQSEVADQNGEA